MAIHVGHCKNLFLLTLMQIMLLGKAHAIEEWNSITEEESLEMERQLKIVNKTPIKSFWTEHGDILDCIDIYKQHAFDNLFLKDHKIQMRPKNIPKGMTVGKYPQFLPNNIRCPPRSVLIKRTTKEDLIMAKKLKTTGLNYPLSAHLQGSSVNSRGYASAIAQYNKHNFGSQATINVWNPSISPKQRSIACIWVANGPLETINFVQAGWGVQPDLYSSNYTRLIAFWTADGYNKTGCYNYLCPGFVQVSKTISLGVVLNQISVYSGVQKEIKISIFRDGEWWLYFNDNIVGYWPQKIFTYMYGGANFVLWGGQVYTPPDEPSPPMGSGHFPEEGHDGKSAYFKQMKIWDNVNLVYPDRDHLTLYTNQPQCYHVQIAQEDVDPHPIDVYYGGPGQCKY